MPQSGVSYIASNPVALSTAMQEYGTNTNMAFTSDPDDNIAEQQNTGVAPQNPHAFHIHTDSESANVIGNPGAFADVNPLYKYHHPRPQSNSVAVTQETEQDNTNIDSDTQQSEIKVDEIKFEK